MDNEQIIMSKYAFERMQAKDVWNVINNLMEMLKTTQPSLYNSVIRQLIKLK